MEKPKRKNSEIPKHIPENALGMAIVMTCPILFLPTFYAGIWVLFDCGLDCQLISSDHIVWWILGIMLVCIALFLWWMPQFVAKQLLNPNHLKITLITIITTAIFIAILTAFGIWLPCLPI